MLLGYGFLCLQATVFHEWVVYALHIESHCCSSSFGLEHPIATSNSTKAKSIFFMLLK